MTMREEARRAVWIVLIGRFLPAAGIFLIRQ
jgi:hypothetical protein